MPDFYISVLQRCSYKKECKTDYKEKCKDVPKEECHYVEKCTKVPYEDCKTHYDKSCQKVKLKLNFSKSTDLKLAFFQEPVEACHPFPKKICKKVINRVPYHEEYEECQRCKQETKEVFA